MTGDLLRELEEAVRGATPVLGAPWGHGHYDLDIGGPSELCFGPIDASWAGDLPPEKTFIPVAHLICLAVNSLPALIAVARAAEHVNRTTGACYTNLRDALSALAGDGGKS